MMRQIIILCLSLVASTALAATFGSWDGRTIGRSGSVVSKWNGKTFGNHSTTQISRVDGFRTYSTAFPFGGGGGTLLVGNNTNLSAGSDGTQSSGSNFIYSSAPNPYFTAVASGTLLHGYLRVGNSTTASNIKMCVMLFSSGTTFNQVECSPATTFAANTLMSFTFNGTHSIASGSNYVLGYIADGYFSAKVGANTWSWMENSSGSYATPPTSVNTATDTNVGYGELEIYVTN